MAKRKQQHLPTMEPPVVPAIDAAAERYAEARDKRMAAGKEEQECQEELLNLMEEKGLTTYDHDDISVVVKSNKKAKVRIGGGSADDDEE